MYGAHRRFEAFRASSCLRTREVHLEDVGEFLDQPAHVVENAARLLLLYSAPRMLDEADRQCCVAVAQLAVDLQRSAGAGEAVLQQCVGAHAELQRHPPTTPTATLRRPEPPGCGSAAPSAARDASRAR